MVQALTAPALHSSRRLSERESSGQQQLNRKTERRAATPLDFEILARQGDVVEAEPDTKDWLTFETGEKLCKHGHADVLYDGNRIVYLAGVVRYRPFTGVAWAFFTPDAARNMASIAIETRRTLRALPFRRVEYYIRLDAGLDASERYAKALGFKCEAPRMRAWAPDGADYALYARVKR